MTEHGLSSRLRTAVLAAVSSASKVQQICVAVSIQTSQLVKFGRKSIILIF